MLKTVTILGSTGSVGRSVIDVLKAFGKDDFIVSALVAYRDYKTLAEQAIALKVKFVALYDAQNIPLLKKMLHGHEVTVVSGNSGIKEVCQLKSDMVIVAISGFASLLPTYYSIMSGSASVIIASKEAIVCGGRILKECWQKLETR